MGAINILMDMIGLGLASVDGFMKRRHGAVVVGSEPGSGITVRLFFAAAGAETGTVAANSS